MNTGGQGLPPNRGKQSSKGRGIFAESHACIYLQSLGWQIKARNYRCVYGEIDIVAVEPTLAGEILAFIEVKARTTSQYGNPLSSITPAKQQKLAACASCFLSDYPQGKEEPQCRFDAIAVTLTSGTTLATITLHRGVFTA